jgi:hypothetical protein
MTEEPVGFIKERGGSILRRHGNPRAFIPASGQDLHRVPLTL